MFQIRVHGRGGQGVVTAAELLSVAAFLEGRHAQAFPSFGSERTGAPVAAFCRIDDVPIRLREPVFAPDALIIQDPTLLREHSVLEGLSPTGFVLVNSARTWAQLGLTDLVDRLPPSHAVLVPASALALTHIGRTVPNAALLGGFAALCGLMSLGSVVAAIEARFPQPSRRATSAPHERHSSMCSPQSGRWPMRRQIEGSRAVAEAVARCRPDVVCAYPISPQTHIVEALSELVRSGQLSRVSISRSSLSSPRCRWRSEHPRPALERIRPRRAKACFTWRRRCTTPPGSVCRS